ncbi:hypothetical protein C4M87_02685 [Mycoplasmopsis pullorum]|uniref:hypothetical protein n=1 Tax=Mycoplasmopsis pullorum TaxID=48003 RepID=UPI0011190514|nr:hypothetical protein [Mycoplasmopsis pullorum]TNK87338.1 hypothetical protein C4M87_02685 [Mycoplasmopsis pullorum]
MSKDFPYPLLKGDFDFAVNDLEDYSESGEFSLNNLEIKESIVQNKLNNLKELKDRIDAKVVSGDSLLDQAKEALANASDPTLKKQIESAIKQYENTKNNLNSETKLDDAIEDLKSSILLISDNKKDPNELKNTIQDFVDTNLPKLDVLQTAFETNLPDLTNLPSTSAELSKIKKDITDKFNNLKNLEDNFKALEAKIDNAYAKRFISDANKLKLDDLEDQLKKAKTPEEAAKILDKMKQLFEKATQESKVMMSELDNLEEDIKWLKKQPQLSNDVDTDLDELRNKISGSENLADLPDEQLKAIYKTWSNELKGDYESQVQDLNDYLQSLRNQYSNTANSSNAEVLKELDRLNGLAINVADQSTPNTITSLKNVITQMNDFIAKKPALDNTIRLEDLIQEKEAHLNDLFNKKNNSNYKPSKFEEVFIANLEGYKNDIAALKAELTPENVDQINEKLNDIYDQINKNTEKANLAKEALNEVDRAEDLLKKAKKWPNAQAETQVVSDKEDVLKNILLNPTSTAEQIKAAEAELAADNDALKQKISYEEQEAMFNDLKKKINETFPNTLNASGFTPMEQAILDKYDSLKEEFNRNVLNDGNLEKNKDEVIKLEQILSLAKELQDTQLDGLQPKIDEAESALTRGTYTNNELPKAYNVNGEISDLINKIKSDSIPNSEEVSALNVKAQNEVNDVEVAIEKDKIVSLNNEIQSNWLLATSPEAEAINAGLSKIDQFAQEALANKTNANDVRDAREKLEAYPPLVEQLKRANDLIDSLEQEQGDSDKNAKIIAELKKAMAQNDINLTDSPEVIAEKTKNLSAIVDREEAKRNLNETLKNDLAEKIDQVSGVEIQSQVLKELNDLKQQAQILLDSKTSTPAEINAKNVEIQAKLAEIDAEIAKNEEDFRAKIHKIEKLKNSLDPQYEANPDKFPFYKDVVDQYLAAKESPKTSLADLDDLYEEMKFAFQRDKAVKFAEDLREKVQPNDEDSTNEYNNLTPDEKSGYKTLQNAIETLTDSILANIKDSKNDYTNYDVATDQLKIEKANDLFNKQTLVADKIKTLKERLAADAAKADGDAGKLTPAEIDLINKDLELLNDMLSDSFASSINTPEEIENKKLNLADKFQKYLDLESKRLESKLLLKDLRKLSADEISPYDATGSDALNNIYNNLFNQINSANSISELENLDKITQIYRDKIDATSKASVQVKDAKDFIDSTQDDPSLKVINKEMQNLINELHTLETAAEANSSVILEKGKQIEALLVKAKIVKEINEIIKQALDKNKVIEYYTYNAQQSDVKRTEVKEWLEAIQQEAFKENNHETLEKIKVKAQKALEIVNEYEKVSIKIGEYQNKSRAGYFDGDLVDAKLLIAKLWNNTASQLFASDPENEEIATKTQILEDSLVEIARLNEKRKWLNDILNAYKTSDAANGLSYQELKENHLELYNALSKRVEQIRQNVVLKATQIPEIELVLVDGQLKEQKLQPEFIKLSTLIKNSETLINSTYSVDSTLVAKISDLQQKIKKAKEGYKTFNTQEQILQSQEEIKIAVTEVEILARYQSVKNIIDNSTLASTDTRPINNLLDEFKREFSQTAKNSQSLIAVKDKYLKDAIVDKNNDPTYKSVNSLDDTTSVTVNDNYVILQVFEDTKELRRVISKAQEISQQKQNPNGGGSIIDTPKAKELYSQLDELITEANSTIQDTPNNELNKARIRFRILDKIKEIRNEKFNQVKELLAKTEKLSQEITENSWTKTSTYDEKAINDLKKIVYSDSAFTQLNTTLDNDVTLKAVNLKIYYATQEFNNQQEKIWVEQQEKLSNVLKNLKSLKEVFENADIRDGSDISLDLYNSKLVNNFNNNEPKAHLLLASLSDTTAFQNNYHVSDEDKTNLSPFAQKVKYVIANSISHIQSEISSFNTIYHNNVKKYVAKEDSATNKKGIIREFKELIESLIQVQNPGDKNIFQQLGMWEVVNSFNNQFLNAYNSFLGIATGSQDETNYEKIISSDNSLVMGNNAIELKTLKALLQDLTTQLKSDFVNIYTLRNDLTQIKDDLKSPRADENTFKAIDYLYAKAKTAYQTLVDQLDAHFIDSANSLTKTSTSETNEDFEARKEEQMRTESAKFIKTINDTKKLFNWLEDNLETEELEDLKANVTPTAAFDITKANAFANKPRKLLLLNDVVENYTNIRPKKQTRYKDFTDLLISLGSQDSNISELDITSYNEIVNLFDEFKFTVIDQNGKLDTSNLRVLVKKRSDGSWYEFKRNSAGDYSSTTIKLNVVYKFVSPNSVDFNNLTPTEFVLNDTNPLEIRFNNSSTAEFPSGRNVFVQTNNQQKQYGQNSSVTIFNFKDAGWLENNQTDDELFNKFWSGLQEKIFNGTGFNNRIEVTPEAYEYSKKDESELNVDSNDNSELAKLKRTALLIKNEKLGIKFTVPGTNSLSGSWTDSINIDKARYISYLDDTTKELVVHGFFPAQAISISADLRYVDDKVAQKKQGNNSSYKEEYGYTFKSETDAVAKSMPRVQLYTWKFKFVVDPNTKDLTSYINHLSSYTFSKNRSLMVDGYNGNGTTDAEKQVWSADNFTKYVYQNNLLFDSNGTIKIPSSKSDAELIRNVIRNASNTPAVNYIPNIQDYSALTNSEDKFRYFGMDRIGGILINNGVGETSEALDARRYGIVGNEKAHNILSIYYNSTIQDLKFNVKD